MKKAKFTKNLTISLAPWVYDEIKKISDQKEISLAEWCRESIDETLENHNEKQEKNNER